MTERMAGFLLHCYQPPRENPWLGEVPAEWSSWPYHDWNERITAECYRANLAVLVGASDDGPPELVRPYQASTLDVGPTLLRWFDRHAPDVVDALRLQMSANRDARPFILAAPFVHAILPLLNTDDRDRLVRWGIQDYRSRFEVAPRGMWLPETACDLASLDCLARAGIGYTVLMPEQAHRVRLAGGSWTEVTAADLDTSRPYRVSLPEGRSITVVFGHGELSRQVAFGDVLDNGEGLGDLVAAATPPRAGALTLVVADGETYGHHHRFGDLGLAWAIRRLAHHHGLTTSLEAALGDDAPLDEVELSEPSSWSCAHGVERWRGDCGCVTGAQPGWRQTWRRPLRDAVDWLTLELGGRLRQGLETLCDDVSETLDDYGLVLSGTLDGSAFVEAHRRTPDVELPAILGLCDAYRSLLYASTSCAWFFADPAEIETAIALRHAALAIERAAAAGLGDLSAELARRLAPMRSPSTHEDGVAILDRATRSRLDAPAIAAAAAVEAAHGVERTDGARGDWVATCEHQGGTTWRVELEHQTTRLRSEHVIEIAGETLADTVASELASGRRYGVGELGEDCLGLLAARVLDPEGADPETALHRLVARLLAGEDIELAGPLLGALAAASRYASPSVTSALRQGLAVLYARDPQAGQEPLSALGKAVGALPGPASANGVAASR